MDNKYLSRGVQLVTALLAAFGGFLLNIAPPDETGVKFAVGISSFLMLLVFLFIAALTQNSLAPSRKKYWLGVAGLCALIFIATAFLYRSNFEKLTFLYPPDDSAQVRYVNGTERTPNAEEQMRQRPTLSRAQLLDKFGEANRHETWTQDSIDRARTTLVVNYVVMVLSLALTFFCLTEGILLRPVTP
ncbi:MAG: hypothetical protein QOG71_384 [Pyrinomonadaceae bacterium]|nr:hypothetical protein [Pyrinomonadaceae bacterium]